MKSSVQPPSRGTREVHRLYANLITPRNGPGKEVKQMHKIAIQGDLKKKIPHISRTTSHSDLKTRKYDLPE